MLTRFPERAHLTSKWALISAYGPMEGGGRAYGKVTWQGHKPKVGGKDMGRVK